MTTDQPVTSLYYLLKVNDLILQLEEMELVLLTDNVENKTCLVY